MGGSLQLRIAKRISAFESRGRASHKIPPIPRVIADFYFFGEGGMFAFLHAGDRQYRQGRKRLWSLNLSRLCFILR
jgi:hypothetical protein